MIQPLRVYPSSMVCILTPVIGLSNTAFPDVWENVEGFWTMFVRSLSIFLLEPDDKRMLLQRVAEAKLNGIDLKNGEH